MRNPKLWLGLSLPVLLLLTPALIWLAARFDRPASANLAGLALILAVISIAIAFVAARTARAMARARRPGEFVARWTVTPDLWAAFRDAEAQRRRQSRARRVVFHPRVASAPVEILAARSAILIDGVALLAEPRGTRAITGVSWVGGTPDCLEFACRSPTAMNSLPKWVPAVFRLPVPRDQRAAAETAAQYYRAAIARGELADPGPSRLLVGVLAVLGALGLVALALGLWLKASGESPDPRAFVLIFIGGFGAAIFGALGYGLWRLLLR